MLTFTGIVTIAAVLLLALVAVGLVLSRLYQRASKEVSYVRTGMGGQKIIMNGGSMVFPVLHETIPVNMNTLRLEVRRNDNQALITKDRMRVDVLAEFYVRVQPTIESIANAAQTLGHRTMQPEALKELVEGKFVDALRAVAAEMAMEELHEQRVEFVQKVQTAVSEDLLKNGLELESVSLTGLDQTDRSFFNPDNAFDAAGLTKLTDEIEDRRKMRNDIERDAQVAIEQKNLEAERMTLQIARDSEYATLEQQREVELRRAAQMAEIASEQAEKNRAAEEARINADLEVQSARIRSARRVEEEQISKEREIKERDIARTKAIETADIEREKTIELTEQGRAIAVAEKSREQSEAQAAANRALAEAVKEEEVVVTVRESERADRQKLVDLIEARRAAEREAIKMTVAADAKKTASLDEAEAIRTIADANAQQQRIAAEGDADAERLRAEAAQVRYTVDAAGHRKLNEAENVLASEIVAMKIKLAIIQRLPEIIHESVKPIENIDGIKIIQVDGLNGAPANGDAGAARAAGSLTDQLVGSALRYRSQAPLIDALLKEIGMTGADFDGLTASLRDGAASDGGDVGAVDGADAE